ncbi:hypothetical protein [Methanosphaerula palustris]|uniref:hypothetical protein n=1 Tax=Methanosphaerula palustris TaxID=475088 RepID=UPI0011D05020|nr:hypothetical protein [Methanosphaerula palustris]
MTKGVGHRLVIEYSGTRFVARRFTSSGATRRALQVPATNADLEVGIADFAGHGKLVLLGVTKRLEFIDVPVHLTD